MRILTFCMFLVISPGCLAADVAVRLSDIDASLNSIAVHAKQYPLRSSSPDERDQVERELKKTINLLDRMVARYPNEPDLLYRQGLANAMGHNFDYPGCAEKAMMAFEKSIELAPENRRTRYEYGVFLSGTKLYEKGIPYLQKASQLGEERAHFTLAYIFMLKNDPDKARTELEAHLKAYPADPAGQKMLKELDSGKFSIHTVTEKPPDDQLIKYSTPPLQPNQ
jgi:tetratricopeptide (TPR) repeat protein